MMNSLSQWIISDQEDLKIRDLSKELEMSVDRSNRILERFLLWRVRDKGLTCGKSSSEDIVRWMNRENIYPPNGAKSLIKWVNFQIDPVIRAQGMYRFKIIEIGGPKLGYNFVWWLDCKQPEQQ